MGKSPFRDALDVLEEIRDFCAQREASYKAWGADGKAFDLRQVRKKAEKAIEVLTPGAPVHYVPGSKEETQEHDDAFGRDLSEP